jgi:heat shock protein HslJ
MRASSIGRILVFALAAGIVAGGCDESPTNPSDLRDVTWRLEAMEPTGAPVIGVSNPDRYTLRLDANGRASVRSDCNSCSGTYTLDGVTLRFGPLACTRAFCGNDSLDTPFTTALGNARSAFASEGLLTVRADNAVLKFRN